MERIRDAQHRYPPSAALQYLLGVTLVSQQQWPEAQAAFERGIELDEDFAQCHNGLAQAHLMQGRFEAAGECALRAIGLLYFFPQAHYHLGRALIGLNEPQRAIRSFEIAVSQSPRFFDAHRELAKLYEQMGDPLKAVRHKRLGDGYPDLDDAM
jgi:tetratricopeptide (TPR) repeat protein